MNEEYLIQEIDKLKQLYEEWNEVKKDSKRY